MKILRLITNIGIGVAVFFLATSIVDGIFGVNKIDDYLLVTLILAGVGIVAKLISLAIQSYYFSELLSDIFYYSILMALCGLIHFISLTLLPLIDFNTFWKGVLLFLGSVIVLCFLTKFVIKGLFSIIDFTSWYNNPAQTFSRIAAGFIAGLSILYCIGGIAQCGLAGFLSLFGIILGLVPSSTTNSESKPSADIRTLPNGREIRDEKGFGTYTDDNGEEWIQNSKGDFVNKWNHDEY